MVYPLNLDFYVNSAGIITEYGDQIDRLCFDSPTIQRLLDGDAIVEVKRGVVYVQSDDSIEEDVEHMIYSLREL